MTETPRERYRAQVRAEIKQHAWEQIASAGVSALSLNAIAKQMGLSGPALYRYFASRDELITELIRDAYRSLADTVRAAADNGADLIALAAVIRDWARADPQRYFLIYGTPVPGYHAPADTTAISDEVMAALLETSGTLPRVLSFWARLQGVLSLELAGHFAGMAVDPAALIADELADLR
ncbi:MAG TPA: TetR/AcrR family transcriptional regulator [Pseudonocardiaceae bacterium]|jgi:AcrR family transcriptional regulator